MATTSQVKADLDSIGQIISGAQRTLDNCKAQLLAARNQLNGLPASYSDTLGTINAYVPLGAFETLAKDEKAKLQTEFLALRSTLEGHLDDLGVTYS